MAHNQDPESQKRKRDNEVPLMQARSPHSSVSLTQQQGNPGFINYLSRANNERLTLLPGNPDTFADIARTLNGYEGVLDRHESLAASLGAKLTGPRLLKGFEKFFEGPIKTNPPQTSSQAISWLDICTFAKSNPEDFTLTTNADGYRCCQFTLKGLQVEISEDDWRFIQSGALSRIPLEHPLEEDESAELATIDILEQRVSLLWRQADAIAARSRIIHHRLGQRRQDILRRRSGEEVASGLGFRSVNQSSRTQIPGTYDLHSDLLQQFFSIPPPLVASRSTSSAGLSQGRGSPSLPSQSHKPSMGRTSSTSEADAQADQYRNIITQRIDKLPRGGPIQPPCDRCRRLRLECVKHLTACQGCTKKHAKCSWKAVTTEEAALLKRDLGDAGEVDKEMTNTELRASEGYRGSIASTEESRPTSQSGGEGPGVLTSGLDSMGGSHDMLLLPGERFELPPMRGLGGTAQDQSHGHNTGYQGNIQHGHPSASQTQGDKHHFGSQPPSR